MLVSYKSRHHVEALLAGWPAALAVALVDNSDNVDGVADLAAGSDRVRYLSGGGQGYARAANLGAFSSDKPYVVFVNPDCRPDVDQIEALLRGVVADERAIAHAATPISHSGVIEIGAGGWEPTVRRAAVHAVGLHKIMPRAGMYAQPRIGEHVDVDWATATCMVVRRAAFIDLGGFDEAFFVYFEDVAFGHQARRHGWHVRLRDDVLVPHGTGTSGAPSAEMRRLQGASFTTYMNRYTPPTVRAAAIRTLYVAGMGWRVAVLTLAGRRERAAASRAIIRGVVTNRAFVADAEVARTRAIQVGPAPAGG